MANFNNNILCGCRKCNDYSVPMRGCCESCLKEDARDDWFEQRGFARFEPQVVDTTGFKPASREQIAEWAAWLSSPEAAAAHERLALEKKAALNAWGDYKFDPLRMEKHLAGMWPEELPKFTNGPMWTAYVHYGEGQKTLQKSYDSVKKEIKTDEDYDKAEKAYKTLLTHVNTHGQLIREMPKHEHKRPVQTSVAPTHVGRRAARRLQVDSAIAAGSG
jgi:hypothetical protein